MNSAKFRKTLLPIGLLSMSVGLMSRSFFHIPDFISGFLIGFGASVVIGGFIVTRFKKPTA